jgi:sulfhydrogenase subunit delta
MEIVDFLGGSSVNDADSPLDVALVEGSVASAREEAALRRIRQRARILVACGSCACFGGISGMDARMPRPEMVRLVYGGEGGTFDVRPHRPLRDFVKVDHDLVGCPIEKDEFVTAVSSLLAGDLPLSPVTPGCHECRMHERDCLLLSESLPCAGSVTAAGCGARCPGYGVPCIGCRGSAAEANLESLRAILLEKGLSEEDLRDRLRVFTAAVTEWPLGEGAA